MVNAAGVDCQQIHELAAPQTFSIRPARGQYYLLDKSEGNRVGRVIFQCPNEQGKGVLVAPTVHGNLIVGPNSEPVEGEDTSTTAAGLAFVRSTRRSSSVPSMASLTQSIRTFAGVRAVADRPGDFVIQLGCARDCLDLAGICSPGLVRRPRHRRVCRCAFWGRAGLDPGGKARIHLYTAPYPLQGAASGGDARPWWQRQPAFGRVDLPVRDGDRGGDFGRLPAGPIPPRSVDAVKRRVNAGHGPLPGRLLRSPCGGDPVPGAGHLPRGRGSRPGWYAGCWPGRRREGQSDV